MRNTTSSTLFAGDFIHCTWNEGRLKRPTLGTVFVFTQTLRDTVANAYGHLYKAHHTQKNKQKIAYFRQSHF
jgi:hypothetical protein